MRRPACILLILFSLALPALGAEPALILNTPGLPPYHNAENTGFFDVLMAEAFGRLHLTVRVQTLPAERSLTNVNDGIDDGDIGRIAGLSADYPNLLQIPENVVEADFMAFVREVRFRPDGWASLAPYHVGIIRGHKIAEAGVQRAQSHTMLVDPDGLFKMLDAGRIDVAVCERYFGEATLRRLKMQAVQALEPPLERRKFYLYLHRRHETLAPKIDAALAAMKSDGSFQRILKQTLSGP